MCRTISLDGQEIDCERDLSRVMPKGLVLLAGYHRKGFLELTAPGDVIAASDKETCLCPINIPATADLNGYDFEHDETWNDYVFTRKDGQP